MQRSPKLDQSMLKAATAAIKRMYEPITWDRVIMAVHEEVGTTYTRQALCRHEALKAAYNDRKDGAPRSSGPRRRSRSAQKTHDTLKNLRSEVQRLRKMVADFEELFVRVNYNAYIENIDEKVLYRSLPPIDRAGAKAPRRHF